MKIIQLRYKIIALLLLAQLQIVSQTFLRISYPGLVKQKTYDIYLNETIGYKCKGDVFYHKSKLIALSDSTLVFENNKEVKHSDLKAIRLNLNIHLVKTFGFVFIAGGIGFLPLNTLNHLIINDTPIFEPKAAYIAAGLVVTGILIKELETKRIRITKNKNLKVLTHNYQHLNEKDSIE
jgi:hypothetical protein